MTFWSYFESHGQRLMGRLTVGFSTASTLLTAGAFHDLISVAWEKGLAIAFAIITAMLGGAIVTRASNVAGQIKIADVVSKALDATPGSSLPPEVTKLANPPETTS